MTPQQHYSRLRTLLPDAVTYVEKQDTYYLTRCDALKSAFQHVRKKDMHDIRLDPARFGTDYTDIVEEFNKFFANMAHLESDDWRLKLPSPASLNTEHETLLALFAINRTNANGFDLANAWIRPAVSRTLFNMVFEDNEFGMWSSDIYEAAYALVAFLDGKYRSTDDMMAGISRLCSTLDDRSRTTKLDRSTMMAKFAVFATGHETPANVISNIFAYQPKALNERSASIVAEGIRIDPPIQCLFRTTVHEMVLEGQVIPKGSRLGLHLGLASRDERRFVNPDHFDLSNDHDPVGLLLGQPGAGCPGRNTAFQIVRSLAPILGAEIRDWQAGGITWLSTFDVRGISTLPIRPKR